MAIDWVVDLDCVPKTSLGFAGWFDRVRKRRTLIAARAGGARDETEIQIGDGVPTPLHVVEAGLRRLKPLETHCSSCPANALDAPFGCDGTIAYPIPTEAEEWLMSRLPSDLDSTAGELLTAAIEDYDFDGKPAAELRKRGLFVARKPVVRRWEGTRISSDQLLHMMFFVGDLEPMHLAMLALFLGCAPHDVDGDDLEEAMEDEQKRRALFEAGRAIEAKPPNLEMATFVRAVAIGASLGVGVKIDA